MFIQMKTMEQMAREVIRSGHGLARTRDLLAAGVHPRVLYRMRDEGRILSLSRGLFQLPEEVPDEPDLSIVAQKIPSGVICLISALSFHGITTEIPAKVSVALRRGSEKPRLAYPPLRFFWMSGRAFEEGIERHPLNGATLSVYSAEKTLADCFKYRNKIGMDVVLEALKLYRERFRFDANRLMQYARVCRVESVMKPYLEAVL